MATQKPQSAPEPQQNNAFEELYLQEKKKASLFLIAIIVLIITTAGSLAWGLTKSSNTTNSTPNGQGSFEGGNGQGGFNGQGGRGGPGGGMSITSFFNDDKSVDTEAVEDFIDRMPSGAGENFLTRFKENITQAVTDGDITQAQADALNTALSTASSESN